MPPPPPPPPPATTPTDALSKWGLWDDQDSLKTVVVALLLYDDKKTFMKVDIVVYHLRSKGDQYECMDAKQVGDIWDCIRKNASDGRNPYSRLQTDMKVKGEKSQEIQEIFRDLRFDENRSQIEAKLAQDDGEPNPERREGFKG